MVALIALAAMLQDDLVRTPAIYRCRTAEGESKFLAPMVSEEAFDTYCIEPKPGPSAMAALKATAKQISGKLIDTKPNLLWRNATIDFVNGKISPKVWLSRVGSLKETIHILSNSHTQPLREATGQESRRAVFAEMFLLSLPGKPCLTSDDIGGTRYLPDPGRLASWILAMHDYMGPMLYMRSSELFVVTGKPKIIRADAKPGLLIFEQSTAKKTITFYLNNGPDLLTLPKIDLGNAAGIMLGVDVEGESPRLGPQGFFFTTTEK
ncbi:hypothetical protein BH11ARM1_BH11ARM1_00600 [soil metagenome]